MGGRCSYLFFFVAEKGYHLQITIESKVVFLPPLKKVCSQPDPSLDKIVSLLIVGQLGKFLLLVLTTFPATFSPTFPPRSNSYSPPIEVFFYSSRDKRVFLRISVC